MASETALTREMGVVILHNLRLRMEGVVRMNLAGVALTRMEMHALDAVLDEWERTVIVEDESEEVIERVARAMYDEYRLGKYPKDLPMWHEAEGHVRRDYMARARGVLARTDTEDGNGG